MDLPHKFHDGTLRDEDCPIFVHTFRIHGGKNPKAIGHGHFNYGHLMVLMKVEPSDAEVWMVTWDDGVPKRAPLAVADALVAPKLAWYVKPGVRHYLDVPEGAVAYIWCIASHYDKAGLVVSPLEEFRGPQSAPEPWR